MTWLLNLYQRWQNLWSHVLTRTTPRQFSQSQRIRSRYQRLMWAVAFVTLFFLITVIFADDDASANNSGMLFYLITAACLGFFGYLAGLYLTRWLRQASPFYRLRNRSGRRRSKSR